MYKKKTNLNWNLAGEREIERKGHKIADDSKLQPNESSRSWWKQSCRLYEMNKHSATQADAVKWQVQITTGHESLKYRQKNV